MTDFLDWLRLSIHVLAATIWVGGQITLAVLVPVLKGAGAEVPKQAAHAFNKVAWPAFWVLVLTGAWNMLAEDHLNQAVLGVKMLAVVGSGATAWLHAHAKTRKGMAINGALTGVFAIAALLLGVALAG